jgi:hypothetical protein
MGDNPASRGRVENIRTWWWDWRVEGGGRHQRKVKLRRDIVLDMHVGHNKDVGCCQICPLGTPTTRDQIDDSTYLAVVGTTQLQNATFPMTLLPYQFVNFVVEVAQLVLPEGSVLDLHDFRADLPENLLSPFVRLVDIGDGGGEEGALVRALV